MKNQMKSLILKSGCKAFEQIGLYDTPKFVNWNFKKIGRPAGENDNLSSSQLKEVNHQLNKHIDKNQNKVREQVVDISVCPNDEPLSKCLIEINQLCWVLVNDAIYYQEKTDKSPGGKDHPCSILAESGDPNMQELRNLEQVQIL